MFDEKQIYIPFNSTTPTAQNLPLSVLSFFLYLTLHYPGSKSDVTWFYGPLRDPVDWTPFASQLRLTSIDKGTPNSAHGRLDLYPLQTRRLAHKHLRVANQQLFRSVIQRRRERFRRGGAFGIITEEGVGGEVEKRKRAALMHTKSDMTSCIGT